MTPPSGSAPQPQAPLSKQWSIYRIVLLLALVIVVVVTSMASLIFFGAIPACEQWQAMAGNILSEIFGIAVTVLIIDQIIAYRREQERQRWERSALRELRQALAFWIGAVASMNKRTGGGELHIRDYKKLLTPETAQRIASLKLASSEEVGGYSIDRVARVHGHFVKTAKEITDRYMVHLSRELFEAIEEVAWLSPASGGTFSPEGAKKMVEALRRLADVYYSLGGPPLRGDPAATATSAS